MKETVLLTGGAGFIGSHIAVELLQRDYDVVIADDLSNSRPDVPERIEKITGRAPVFYRMDVSDRQALDRVFRAHDIAAAVHLAGYKAVGESVQKPLAYYRNNLDTTLALLEVMADHGVHRLIFSSSATVYGNAEAPCREDMPTGGCTNPYAWTKLMIEQILRDAAKADPSLAAVCLRYFNPVGAHESGLIGELPNGIPNNLMPYITQTAAGIRRELTGKRFLWYVCCGPDHPNTFLRSDLCETRLIGALTRHMKFDGFLRWNYTVWPDDPRRDIRYGAFASGDTNFVYPARNGYPLLSLRYMALRRAIEDFELLRRLDEAGRAQEADELAESVLREKDVRKYFFPAKEEGAPSDSLPLDQMCSVDYRDYEKMRRRALELLSER